MEYYVNNKAQTNGDHEVHKKTCDYLPSDKEYLGDFGNCTEAVNKAKKTHSQSNGCKYCSPACHTT